MRQLRVGIPGEHEKDGESNSLLGDIRTNTGGANAAAPEPRCTSEKERSITIHASRGALHGPVIDHAAATALRARHTALRTVRSARLRPCGMTSAQG